MLKLVKLYPIDSPVDVFSINSADADFPASFSKLSISVWLCKYVEIRGPSGNEPSILMQFNPSQAHIVLKDVHSNLLFEGTFSNPEPPKDEYHVAFSVDTEAQTYTFRGNGIAWTADVSFPNIGEINNIPYDLQLAQINANLGGLHRANSSWGFPNTNFNTMLFSYWMCGPQANQPGANGYPGIWPNFDWDFFSFGPSTINLGNKTISNFYQGNFVLPSLGVRMHMMLSVDTHSQIVQVYINDANISITGGTWTGTPPFNFNVGSINIWDWNVSGVIFSNRYPGMGDVWLTNPPEFVDLSIADNRRKFINADLTPVDLGDTGTNPFGYQPNVYMSVRSGGVATDILINRGSAGSTWNYDQYPPTLQASGSCFQLAAPPPWMITSKFSSPTEGGIGDLWLTDTYVDFADSSTLVKFINTDSSWTWLGENGQLPTGISPVNWLTVQSGNSADDFLVGYGQYGSQSSWDLFTRGADPTTGIAYPSHLEFDICTPPAALSMDNLEVTARLHDVHQVFLRNSNDAGASWGNAVGQSLGEIGEFDTSIQWRRISMSRDRIFEISWSSPVLTSLIGVFVDSQTESS